ncbi:adenosylcobinamide-GDP ribazoletransferase [Magnetofaba australis]|nr:adenosylcobinamide-GDP ribazoletransferase [Magnetofaba australis]
MLAPLVAAFGLLTRLPMPRSVTPDARDLGRSVALYPLVGAVIGAILAAAAMALSHVHYDLAAPLLVALWVWLSGGLHLDGLADATDAAVGGMGDRERALAIMKDPYVGPMGVIAIVLTLLLMTGGAKVLLLWGDPWLFVCAPVAGRCALSALFVTTPYLRADGMGAEQARRAPKAAVWLAILLGLLACGALGGLRSAAALILFLPLLWLLRRRLMRRFGGFTGDIAGALLTQSETTFLILLTVSLSIG